MTNTHKYNETTITVEPIKLDKTIAVDIKDIKHITGEDLKTARTKGEYDKLLLKVYWYLKGINRNTLTKDEGSSQLLEEIEEFIYD